MAQLIQLLLHMTADCRNWYFRLWNITIKDGWASENEEQ
jgi:hypothetical protein